MTHKGRAPLRALIQRVHREYPTIDAAAAIASGHVRVGGRTVTNPRSVVRDDAPVTVGPSEVALRGEAKLEAALDSFRVAVAGRIALDLGASSGGFTRVLRRAGAARVYAVDAGFGQLLGSLRQDPAVVNLERTNLGGLSPALVPDEISIVTVDLSYLGIASALRQLAGRVSIAPHADLLALVKPTYELRLSEPPCNPRVLRLACERAVEGATAAGWRVRGVVRSPVTGRNRAVEFLMHARRHDAYSARAERTVR
jgi:23S rRNA (cytidine1920-2'-O)/16S rRNA (cytidine1409-2'-O)-methyltransferase